MPTKRLPLDELRYPRRRVNDMLRTVLWCPLCKDVSMRDGKELHVVKWRAAGVRLECPVCGLRFTIDRNTFDDALGQAGDFHSALARVVLDGG